MQKYLDKIKISKTNQKRLILFAIFAMMLVLNFLTPLIADDYSYSFGLYNKRITSITDIVLKQIDHYLTWGGRTVAHSLANFFLMYSKMLFNVLNSFVYTVLVYLIYKHAQTTKEEKPLMLILIHLGLYFLTPVFGQNCIWLIGSCNYLWTTVIILSFLLMYREKDKKKDTVVLTLGMFLLGVIAGWTNENTAFGLIVVTALSMFAYKGKNKLPKYKIGGLVGTITGFVTMILAPGNYVRSEKFVEETSTIVNLLKITLHATVDIMEFIPVLTILVIVILTIYLYKKKKIDTRVWIYLIAAFLTIYGMVLSPTFPERAWFGVVVFLMIGIMTLLYNIESIHEVFNYVLLDIAIISTIIYVGDYITLAADINNLRTTWNYRIETIEKGKKEGITDFEFSEYVTLNPKSPQFRLADVSVEAHSWPNDAVERYYGINSLRRKIEE